jgi:multiple sugar transport system permease protein
VALWLLRPVFGPSASEQEEAALLDGASRFRVFIEIAVPMAAAGLAATALVIFILCWNEYLFAAWLASDHAMTVPPWMVGQLSMKEAQASAEDEEVARLAAAVVLMMAPLVVFAGIAAKVLSRAMLWRR